MTILDQPPPGDVLADDVEAPAFAPWSRRVVAALLDSAILTGTAFVVEGYQHGITWWGGVGAPDPQPRGREVLVAGAVLPLMQAYTGATPGKRVAGIRVVHEGSGRPIGALRTLGRTVAHFLDGLCMIGYLRPLWHERRRTFADSVVGTDVVLGRPGPRVGGVVDVWTAAAAVVCTVAVGLSTGGTTSLDGAQSFPCAPSDGSHVELAVPPTPSYTRLGLTRVGVPTDDLTTTWTFPADTVPPDGTVLTSTLTAADGSWTVSRETQVWGGPDADPEGVWTVVIPTGDLQAVGSSWTWRADVTPPDGADPVAVCSLEHASG